MSKMAASLGRQILGSACFVAETRTRHKKKEKAGKINEIKLKTFKEKKMNSIMLQ